LTEGERSCRCQSFGGIGLETDSAFGIPRGLEDAERDGDDNLAAANCLTMTGQRVAEI
jgi:hypothetical protein